MFVQGLTAFSLTTVMLLLLIPWAQSIGLVDHPGERKQHIGQIPLIGGLAIFCAMLVLLPWFAPLNKNVFCYQ